MTSIICTSDDSAHLTSIERLPTHLKGWWPAVFSTDLKPGSLIDFDISSHKLVAWRCDKTGLARIFNAACPHLGARLSQGTVSNGRVMCGYHGWKFENDGTRVGKSGCDHKVFSWPVSEKNGLVMVWYGSKEPEWDIPDIADPLDGLEWWPAAQKSFRVNLHPFDIHENNCDYNHFMFVHDLTHKAIVPVDLKDSSMEIAHLVKGPIVKVRGKQIAAVVEIHAKVINHGIALVESEIKEIDFFGKKLAVPSWLPTKMKAIVASRLIGSKSEVFLSVSTATAPAILRLPASFRSFLGRIFSSAYLHDLDRQLACDAVILEKRIRLANPQYADNDVDLAAVIKWSYRFAISPNWLSEQEKNQSP